MRAFQHLSNLGDKGFSDQSLSYRKGTHASLLLEQGVSVDTISRRSGHENSRITREIYLYVTEKLKERDNECISTILAGCGITMMKRLQPHFRSFYRVGHFSSSPRTSAHDLASLFYSGINIYKIHVAHVYRSCYTDDIH